MRRGKESLNQSNIENGSNIDINVQYKATQKLDLFRKDNNIAVKTLQKCNSKNITSLNLSSTQLQVILKKVILLDWSNLTYLSLSFCDMTSNQILKIKSSNWPKLAFLDLTFNKITNEGLKHLSDMNLNLIENLSLRRNAFDGNGIKYIINSNLGANLKLIDLSQNNIGAKGAKQLTKGQFPKLSKLYLNNCDLQNEGVKHLTKGKWGNLLELQLKSNKIGVDGNQNLSCLYPWKKLIKNLKRQCEQDQDYVEDFSISRLEWVVRGQLYADYPYFYYQEQAEQSMQQI